MGNSIFGFENAVLTGVLNAGSQENTLGVLNLIKPHNSPSTGWQTKTGAVVPGLGAWLTLNNITEVGWRAFMLANTNLTKNAQVRVRVGPAEGILDSYVPNIDIDFCAGDTFTAPATGTWTFTRASVAWRCKSDGTWEQVAGSTPRIHHDPITGRRLGILSQVGLTNMIRNPRGEGGTVPGTFPTNMTATVAGGITAKFAGTDTIDGLPGFWVALSGTAGASASFRLDFDTNTNQTAANGNTFVNSSFIKTEGSTTGATLLLGAESFTSAPASLGVQEGTPWYPGNTNESGWPTRNLGASQRFYSVTLAGGATTANVRPYLKVAFTNGTVVNLAIFIAGATSYLNCIGGCPPIYPTAGTPAKFTCNAESWTYAPPASTILDSTGTLYGEWSNCFSAVTSSNPSQVIACRDSAGQNVVGIYSHPQTDSSLSGYAVPGVSPRVIAANVTVLTGATEKILTAANSTNRYLPCRAALAWGASQNVKMARCSTAGGAGVMHASTYTPGSMPTGMDRLSGANVQFFIGAVARVRYYNQRLPDNVLIGIAEDGFALDSTKWSYDSRWLSDSSGIPNRQVLALPPSAVSAPCARVDLYDPDNPDGFLNIAGAYLGPVWETSYGVSWESTMGSEVKDQVLETRGGQQFVEPQYRQRAWELQQSAILAAELWDKQQPMERVAALGQNVLFIPDKTSSAAKAEAIFGILKSSGPVGFSTRSKAYRSWKARITERT